MEVITYFMVNIYGQTSGIHMVWRSSVCFFASNSTMHDTTAVLENSDADILPSLRVQVSPQWFQVFVSVASIKS